VVLVLAAVDSVVGVYLLAHGVRKGQAETRWVGVALLVCALELGSTPWLMDDEPMPTVARFERV